MRIALILIVVLLAGCGYHTPGSSDDWVGGDARLLYIQLIDNQTAEPYLENFLTDALVAELSRSRVVTLTEDQTQADVRLAGEIKEFTSSAFAYGTSDQITEYRATMRISVRLLRKDTDEVLWQKAFQRSEDYLASVNKNQKHEELEGQRLSARQVSLRLAEDIYSSLLNSF